MEKDQVAQDLIGYLNFSNGTPDAGFQSRLNWLQRETASDSPWRLMREFLRTSIDRLEQSVDSFRDSSQARQVVATTFDNVWPAYRHHHRDLLFHVRDEEFEQPFFLARLFEAVLAQGAPWDQTDRIVQGSLDQLNDFIGFRPVAVLENGQKMQPYDHEKHRPLPIYLRGAGVACGKYEELLTQVFEFFKTTPTEMLETSHFYPDHLDEIAVDLRAHDHSHPVNKRTNYMFGEWDPHQIDSKGHYRRFVVRKIILDSLLDWLTFATDVPPKDRLHDASAVLCGTILMASSISGSGPGIFSSDVTLTSLLPIVARQRDAFYAMLVANATGQQARRLRHYERVTQQAFGHVRQALNLFLARYGASQVQHRHLAQLFARMGYADASRAFAAKIPAPAIRFESEIMLRLTSAGSAVRKAALDEALELLVESEDLLHRGIECGAIADPWSILGFQGNFPLFSSREDAIPDERFDVLLEIVGRFFTVYTEATHTAALRDDPAIRERISRRFHELAVWWDQFATTVVDDLPRVSGIESWNSANVVAHALREWRQAGEAGGDIAFWKERVHEFRSPGAFATLVRNLLEKEDYLGSLALLVQWLSEADQIDFHSPTESIPAMFQRWMARVAGTTSKSEVDTDAERADLSRPERWKLIARMFDTLEVNAGEYWQVPHLDQLVDGAPPPPAEPDLATFDNDDDEDDDSDEDDLFQAAYDGIVYRDSTFDGHSGDTLDGPGFESETEFDSLSRSLEPHIKFIDMLSEMWEQATGFIGARSSSTADDVPDTWVEHVESWVARGETLEKELKRLLLEVWRHEVAIPSGELDSNLEYDMQLQTKLFLMHAVTNSLIKMRRAVLCLQCILPRAADKEETAEPKRDYRTALAEVYRVIQAGDVEQTRQLLPVFLGQLSGKPLLYVPLDQGGDPFQLLAVRVIQNDLKFLVGALPRLGLYRETWQIVRFAFRLERRSRPAGMVVTEFDRLFRRALQSTLECLFTSAMQWRKSKHFDTNLVELVAEIVEHYHTLWLKHSRSTRLSTVESMDREIVWSEVTDFIKNYGDGLFHARHLTLGNVRTILHLGVESFLDYLAENDDPLHPSPLIRDLEAGKLDRDDTVRVLELIYGSVVDKFDQFLEYNTTTTQSDYGEKFYCFLEFLRLEADYDHDAWNLLPLTLAHEVLVQAGKREAAYVWEDEIRERSREMADEHIERLKELEQTYGMRLPAVADHLNERFVKPLSVNRMVGLLAPAIAEARENPAESESFPILLSEIEAYLEDSFGSGIEAPPWLQQLDNEAYLLENELPSEAAPMHAASAVPLTLVTKADVKRQLNVWKEGSETKRAAKVDKKSPEHKDKSVSDDDPPA